MSDSQPAAAPNTAENSQLGKTSAYVDRYDAGLLFPIPRLGKRQEIGLPGAIPFMGADLWTAYELSWLNPKGKPQVALAQFTVPCDSPCIVESKSLKLYLNSFNNTRLADADEVRVRLQQDLSAAAGAGVAVALVLPEAFDAQPIHELDGLNLSLIHISQPTRPY